jgi:hypothetical protein
MRGKCGAHGTDTEKRTEFGVRTPERGEKKTTMKTWAYMEHYIKVS